MHCINCKKYTLVKTSNTGQMGNTGSFCKMCGFPVTNAKEFYLCTECKGYCLCINCKVCKKGHQ